MDESKEREAFERWWAERMRKHQTTYMDDVWLGRAALAQPEPEPEQWKVVDEWAGGCCLRRVQPEPEPELPALTDERIIEIRDEHLPSQGEPFDCIAFARAAILADRKRREG